MRGGSSQQSARRDTRPRSHARITCARGGGQRTLWPGAEHCKRACRRPQAISREAGKTRSSALSTARTLSDRLIARAAEDSGSPVASAAAAARACERFLADTSRWLGVAGAQVIFARVSSQLSVEHPVLTEIRVVAAPAARVEGVTAGGEDHDERAARKALESVLIAALELLGRLVGDDMVAQMVENNATSGGGNR